MIGSQKSVKKGPKQITRYRKLQIRRKESQNGKTSQIGKKLPKGKKKEKGSTEQRRKGRITKDLNHRRTENDKT